MDPSAIVAGISSVAHLTNITKALGSYIKETGKAEAMEKLMDLNSAILDLQQKHAELFDENRALKEQNRELKQRNDFRSALRFEQGVYWRTHAGENEYYCSVCLDRDEKLVRIRFFPESSLGPGWDCRSCKNTFYKS